MKDKDTYLTITAPSPEILYKDKNSKFFGYAFPVNSEDEVKVCLENIKKIHFSAKHYCYAYQIGITKIQYRTNDDGEPNNSAGIPIYGQIQSFGLTNILIIVVRYFGGVKLGVGGLISAYKNTAQETIETSNIIEKTIDIHFIVQFDYKNMNKVMRVIKEKNMIIISQEMETACKIEVSTRKKNAKSVFDIFNMLFEVNIKEI